MLSLKTVSWLKTVLRQFSRCLGHVNHVQHQHVDCSVCLSSTPVELFLVLTVNALVLVLLFLSWYLLSQLQKLAIPSSFPFCNTNVGLHYIQLTVDRVCLARSDPCQIHSCYPPLKMSVLDSFTRATPAIAVFAVATCLSVRHVGVLYPDGWRYRQTSFSAR